MGNMNVTNIDLGSVILSDAEFRDELLVFGGAGTVAAGTILARKRVSDSITVAAGTNTGNGTCAAAVYGNVASPVAGAWELKCTDAVTNGGVFKLTDPAGVIVKEALTLTAGAGVSTIFYLPELGLKITVTDGSTDFAANDLFTLTVAADNKLVVYAASGIGGANIPAAVVTYPVTAAGAGNVSIRAMIAGKVRAERLVVSGGSVTVAILDALRRAGIVAVSVDELNALDNQ